jgi:predicted PurR-regulated permease PerM
VPLSPGTQSRSIVRFEIAPRSIVVVLVAVAAVWLAYQLWMVALILVIALILAGTFNPVVEWMERHWCRRFYALVLLFIALAVVSGLLLFLTVPPLIEQLTQIVADAPATRARLLALLNERSITTPLAHVVANAQLPEMFARIEKNTLSYSSQAVRAIGYGATALVLSFYLLADGKRTQGMVYAIVPRDYHMRLARILQNLETIVGGYMRGQLLTSAVMGVFVYVLLAICGVPNALSLALFAAVVDVIPFIGGFLVIAPAVLAALSRGVPVAGVVLALLLAYMEFESRILVPKVYGKVLRLSSTVVILALVAGGILMGIVGALLALPIAAGLLMIMEELRVEMPGDDSVDPSVEARHAKTEATYEKMSAGATAPEAGEIAKNLAHDIRDADLADLVDAAKQSAGVEP